MKHLLLWLLARAASPLGAAPRRCTRLRAMSLDDAAPVAIDGDESLVAAASVAYDPDAAEASLWRRPAAWLARNVELLLPLVGFVGRVAGDRFVGREASLRERRASELREILGSLGPAVIKAGQALASRPDLLPAEYLRELQKLQDRVPAFDTGDALRRVEASLGLQRFDDAFELLEAEPIAAASIGQVYKARLIKEDVVVALKVQRPRCAEIIALDLYILRWWAQLGTSTLSAVFDRNLDLVSVIDDFGRLIYQEIDYAAERKNARRFGDLYEAGQGKSDSSSLQHECSARARSGNRIHASRALREMIARPKISRNEWKTAERGAFEVGNVAPFSRTACDESAPPARSP